jgi:hypothetical protein
LESNSLFLKNSFREMNQLKDIMVEGAMMIEKQGE